MNEKVYKILIVDDEINVLDALKKTIERAKQFKSDISTVENSQKAIEVLKSQNFDLVLCDYKMPKMNGVEVLTKAKEINPDAIRMLITGYSDLEIAREAINKASVHTYIEKPWDNENLRETIYSAIKEIETIKDPETSLENFLNSEDSSTLLKALISLEEVKEYSHTIIRKDEDRLPQIDKLNQTLNLLSKYDYVKKVEKSPIVFKCPICASYDYRLIVKCPLCGSDYLEKGDVIEHYNCGHVDMYSNFESGTKLSCPKCGDNLRQIGEDYRKVGDWIHCRQCGEFFGEGNLNLLCNSCGSSSIPNQTIWEYEKRIMPNKERLTYIKTKLDIFDEIKRITEKNGLFLLQNMKINENSDERKYDILIYQKNPVIDKEDNPPLFIADLGITPTGIFSEKIKDFYDKSKNSKNKNIYFIAYPFLSDDSKKLCEKLNIQTIETPNLKTMLNQLFENRPIPPIIANKSNVKVLKLKRRRLSYT
ncbi:MAG: response regulator [Candidatus Methanofastidiosa archaeon]|nr:response regulator [Candidatus Methanofastidiosa archaeon]